MNPIYLPAILLIGIMIMIFILMQTQQKLASNIGEVRREMASLEKKYNDLYHQFNRHIHNDVHVGPEI